MAYLLNWFIIGCIVIVSLESMDIDVKEETKPSSIIGSVSSMHPLISSPKYIMSSQFIKINRRGQVLLKQRIDLESVCFQWSVCCGIDKCIIPIPILVKDRRSSRTRSLKIQLVVQDVNDHAPKFEGPRPTIVKVREGARVGDVVSIRGATDKDKTAANRISHYEFQETSGSFMLNQTDLEDLRLVVKKRLDYESRRDYSGKLTACDSGQRCAKTNVLVKIEDENDNDPIFLKALYERKILEDFNVGQEVIRVRATDKDAAPYNETVYGYVSTTDRDLVATFKVERTTGSITLQRRLSASVRMKYNFQVFAMDGSKQSRGKKTTTKVLISVQDINDNKPSIKLIEERRLVIMENAEAPQDIVDLEVKDGDQGDNGNVSCSLNPVSRRDFRLYSNGLGIYSLTTRRKFDYEKQTRLRTTITCSDKGRPPKYETKPLTIYVEDENEYAPRCERTQYKVDVKENRPPNVPILQIRGNDSDGSANLTYTIHGPSSLYFHIHPTSGQIVSSQKVLDKESINNLDIKVRVSDGAKKGECEVKVQILDENDHEPIFTMESPKQLSVPENQPPHTLIQGALTAVDNDKDDKNHEVHYQLTRVYGQDRTLLGDPIFDVTPTGHVKTLQRLDRELHSNYTVTVMALDRGWPVKSTSMNVTVLVTDTNDNQPEWVHPKHDNGQTPRLNLSSSFRPGEIVAKLQAFDRDAGENGRVSYRLLDNDRFLFAVNSSTGELSIARLLPVGRVNLVLRASDNGYPVQHRDQRMLVFVEGSGDVARLNTSIILVLIGVTGVVALFLIVAIVCVQRKPRYSPHDHHHSSQQSFQAPASKLPPSTYVFGGGNFVQDDCRSVTGVPHTQLYGGGDAASLCYMPHDTVDSAAAGLALQSFMTHHKASPKTNYNLDNYSTLPNQSRFIASTNQFSPALSSNHNLVGGSVHDIRFLQAPTNTVTMVTQTGHTLDDDSADSGRGASEDDPGFMHHHHQQQQQLLLMQHGDYYQQSTIPKGRLLYSPTNLTPYQNPVVSNTTRALASPTNSRYMSPNNQQYTLATNTSATNTTTPPQYQHNNTSNSNQCYVVTEEHASSPLSLDTDDVTSTHDHKTTMQNAVTTFTQLT